MLNGILFSILVVCVVVLIASGGLAIVGMLKNDQRLMGIAWQLSYVAVGGSLAVFIVMATTGTIPMRTLFFGLEVAPGIIAVYLLVLAFRRKSRDTLLTALLCAMAAMLLVVLGFLFLKA